MTSAKCPLLGFYIDMIFDSRFREVCNGKSIFLVSLISMSVYFHLPGTYLEAEENSKV